MDKELMDVIGWPTKTQKVGLGKVKFYNNDADKQFGFLTSEYGDVFIHGQRCYRLVDNGTDLPGLGKPQRTSEGELFIPPRKNYEVLFIADNSRKGRNLQAIRWTIWVDEVIQPVFDSIMNRPVYQLVVSKTEELDIGSSNVLWEGQDLKELRASYPKHRYPISDQMYFVVDNVRVKDPR